MLLLTSLSTGTNPSHYQVATPSTSGDRSRPGEGIANLTACLRDAVPKPSVPRLYDGVERRVLRVSNLRIRAARGRCFSRRQIYRPAFGLGVGSATAVCMQSSG
jgi:hypothetical protein